MGSSATRGFIPGFFRCPETAIAAKIVCRPNYPRTFSSTLRATYVAHGVGADLFAVLTTITIKECVMGSWGTH